MLRVLIADDNGMSRLGLRTLLFGQFRADDLVICGEADSAVRAVELARELKPDLVLLSGWMALSAPGTIARVKQACPPARIIVLTGGQQVADKALSGGAHLVILKQNIGLDLIPAIEAQLKLTA